MKKELSKLKEELIDGNTQSHHPSIVLKPHGPTSVSAALPATKKVSISLLCWQQSGRSWPSPAAPKDPEDPLDHPLSERRTATTPQQHISSMAEMVRTIMYSDKEERWCLEMWNSDL